MATSCGWSRSGDTAGDDQADSGSKAAEHDTFRSVLGVID